MGSSSPLAVDRGGKGERVVDQREEEVVPAPAAASPDLPRERTACGVG